MSISSVRNVFEQYNSRGFLRFTMNVHNLDAFVAEAVTTASSVKV
jgi:hypothetical protein